MIKRFICRRSRYRSQYFEGGRVLTAAISATDIALHDLVAKAAIHGSSDMFVGRNQFTSFPLLTWMTQWGLGIM